MVLAISNRHQQENLPQLSDLLCSEHLVFFHKVKVLLKYSSHFTVMNGTKYLSRCNDSYELIKFGMPKPQSVTLMGNKNDESNR